jgi:hypothetical protein
MDHPCVYVLGAGMSVDAGIPAMNDLTSLILSEKYMLGGTNLIANCEPRPEHGGALQENGWPQCELSEGDCGTVLWRCFSRGRLMETSVAGLERLQPLVSKIDDPSKGT